MCDVRGEDVGTDLERHVERIYREQGARLWCSLVLSTGSPEVADEAVAEAFAQAIARGDALSDPAAWIWRAAFRIAAGEMKARSPAGSVPVDLGSVEEPEPLIDLVRALGELTPHQRTAVVLADYAGYPHREIAQILGSSVSAVGVHVYRARRRLRALLEAGDA
ncbi:MAG: sigma-70 family RNA polymerase sigma factor [Actinobacteria bacterium]|nr:sigma-70 family RNA polymerase sigma factor [Actinomycetota bacterium]